MGTVDSVDYSECRYLMKMRDRHILSVHSRHTPFLHRGLVLRVDGAALDWCPWPTTATCDVPSVTLEVLFLAPHTAVTSCLAKRTQRQRAAFGTASFAFRAI